MTWPSLNRAHFLLLQLLCLSFFINIFPIFFLFNGKLSYFPSTDNQFTNRDIALMLGVSQRTVERRMTELQLSNLSRYSNIEDDMLDSFVQRIVMNFPRSGK